MCRGTTMWKDREKVVICKSRKEAWNAFSAPVGQGFSLLSFTQHLSDEIFSNSLEKSEEFLTDSNLHRNRTPFLLNNLPKASTFSHIQLLSRSVRCFDCCVFVINMFMLVLCSVRSGLDKCLVIYLGNMVSKEGCEKKLGQSLFHATSQSISFCLKEQHFHAARYWEHARERGKILFQNKRTVEYL